MKSIAYLTRQAQAENGWSFGFANAYVCARYIEGLPHRMAYANALRNPLVKEDEKPRVAL